MVREKEVIRTSWKRLFYKLLNISSLLLVIVLGNATLVQSANVSGVVYKQDGTTPITNTVIHVGAYAGDPCHTFDSLIIGVFNQTNGTFVVDVPAGTYYLYAYDTQGGNYLLEWWTPAGSTPKCSNAVPISVIAGSKYFQLNVAQPGDVNRDGEVSLVDAIITLQNLTGQNENRVWLSGDVNGDLKIGLPEVIYVLKAISQQCPSGKD